MTNHESELRDLAVSALSAGPMRRKDLAKLMRVHPEIVGALMRVLCDEGKVVSSLNGEWRMTCSQNA
jgi:hypothetical protein